MRSRNWRAASAAVVCVSVAKLHHLNHRLAHDADLAAMRVGAGVLVVAAVAFGHVLPPGHIDNVFSVQDYGAVRCARFTLWQPSLNPAMCPCITQKILFTDDDVKHCNMVQHT